MGLITISGIMEQETHMKMEVFIGRKITIGNGKRIQAKISALEPMHIKQERKEMASLRDGLYC